MIVSAEALIPPTLLVPFLVDVFILVLYICVQGAFLVLQLPLHVSIEGPVVNYGG